MHAALHMEARGRVRQPTPAERLREALAQQQRRGPLRPKPYPRPPQPEAIRGEYEAALLRFVAAAQEEVQRHLGPVLARLLESPRGDGLRLDAPKAAGPVRKALESAASALLARFPNATVQRLAGRTAQAVSATHLLQLRAAFRASLGVDLFEVFASEPGLQQRMASFTRDNVALVRSLSSAYFQQVESEVVQGVREGVRAEELARRLQQRTGVAASRAQLIARDQVGKFYGALQQSRQEALGVTRYRWRTVRDNRVRSEHEDRHGKVFSWESPPGDGHPGKPINCRCWAEPLLEELLEESTPGPRQPAAPSPNPARQPRAPGATPGPAVTAPRRPGPAAAVARRLLFGQPQQPPAPKQRKGWSRTRVYRVPVEELADVASTPWNPGRTASIAKAYAEGKWNSLPPIEVVEGPDGVRSLNDGNHRLAFARANGIRTISVRFLDREASEVRAGRPQEAEWIPRLPGR